MGKANVIVAGGAEAAIFEAGLGGFNAMHALSTRNDDPERASRPFSASRDGFVMGEGAGCLIMILECHRSMDPMEAIAFAKGVEEYRPLFLEDPIPPDSPESMADIAIRTNIPIATGERFINIQEFETTFQKHAAKYVRPDVCALGGLTPSKKVAAMAEANYCKIVPHNPLGPVSTAACLQLDAAIPNFAIQEFPSFYHQGNEAEMTKEAFEEEAGYIVVPDRPGIGIELVDDICERFPAKPRSISAQIAHDGSVYDI